MNAAYSSWVFSALPNAYNDRQIDDRMYKNDRSTPEGKYGERVYMVRDFNKGLHHFYWRVLDYLAKIILLKTIFKLASPSLITDKLVFTDNNLLCPLPTVPVIHKTLIENKMLFVFRRCLV